MLNQVILVGKATEELELVVQENGVKKTVVSLNMDKRYDGKTYPSEEIKCTLLGHVAEQLVEYCKVDSTLGIKAFVRSIEKVMFINVKEKDDS